MSGRLQGRIAVVTGSNSGIGRGIALGYGREGAVVICANRQAESKYPSERNITTHDLIVKNGGKAVFKKMEFSQTESIDALVKEVVSGYGRLDIWVNNAGTSAGTAFCWDLSDEAFDSNVDVNLKGTFRCIRAAARQMMNQEPLASGSRGSVINISSVSSLRGFATSSAYAASKGGITSVTRVTAAELSASRITVNSISPGAVRTAMMDALPDPVHEVLRPRCLLDYGQPEDLAGAAILLASDEGRWITGTDIIVDGGFTIT